MWVQTKKEKQKMQYSEVGTIRKIRDSYTEKKMTKLDELKALDKKVTRPVKIFAYIFGSINSLVLGIGMCLAMKMIGTTLSFALPLGIAIGLIGILFMSVNYPLYKKILSSRKKKYAEKVLSLSDELLNK